VVDVLATFPPHRELVPGRYGASGATAGVKIRTLDCAVATLISGRGQIAALSASALEAFATELPSGPRWIAGRGVEFIGIGPGRWLVLAAGDSDALVDRLETVFAPNASVVDQSGGLVMYEATGAKIREVLPKLLAIDVDPTVFQPGSAATTSIAHIGVTVWLDATGTRWHFGVGRSFDAAFVRAVARAAAEYGLDLECDAFRLAHSLSA
jgi:methylglutamate dehydrogenase subunit D